VRGRKSIRVTGDDLKKWFKACPIITEKMKHQKCKIHYLMFFPDDRIRDGQSYLKPSLDYFVKQGFLNDDNRRIVKGECWEDGGIDKENPRIEVTILSFN
jgi:Holliday junction resolvase RusA-like endonuclease